MVAYQNDMLRTFQDWNKRLWFCRLRCLVNQNLPKLYVPDSSIKGCHTGCANNVGSFNNFIFSLLFEILEKFFVFLTQLTLLIL